MNPREKIAELAARHTQEVAQLQLAFPPDPPKPGLLADLKEKLPEIMRIVNEQCRGDRGAIPSSWPEEPPAADGNKGQ